MPRPMRSVEEYERLADDFVRAFDAGDEDALQRLNIHYERAFSFDDLWAEIWRRVYAFRQRSSRVPKNYLGLEEAQLLIAQDTGCGSWVALTRAVDTGAPAGPPYEIDAKDNRIAPRRQLADREWDGLIDVMHIGRPRASHRAAEPRRARRRRSSERRHQPAPLRGNSVPAPFARAGVGGKR